MIGGLVAKMYQLASCLNGSMEADVMEAIQLGCLIGFLCIIGGMIAVLTGHIKLQRPANSDEASVFSRALAQLIQSPAPRKRQ